MSPSPWRIARADASVAMVVLMHYSAVSVIESHGPDDVRRATAAGEHLSTPAFSERGSRSHFWAPVSTATVGGRPGAAGRREELDQRQLRRVDRSHADSAARELGE
jgi:hypothetical protein